MTKPDLRFYLFGPFEVWRCGERLSPRVWRTRKHAALLKILVSERRRMLPADRLIEWLWPDLTPESGQANLYVGVSLLRRALEPDLKTPAASALILTHYPGYRFEPSSACWIDVDEFHRLSREAEAHVRKGNSSQALRAYQAAAALYRGEYLADDPYEDWAIGARERLRQEYLQSLSELHRLSLATGDASAALGWAQQALALDPPREEAHRQVMRAFYALGRREDALRQFERCRKILRDDLDVEPTPRTQVLHQQMLLGQLQLLSESQALESGLGPLPFVGRESELATLRALLNRARREGCQIALVSGEAGVGKTRLVEEFALNMQPQGVVRLRAHCNALEQKIPYQPLREGLSEMLSAIDVPALVRSLGPWAAVLAGMLPVLSESGLELAAAPALGPAEEQARLLHALTRLVQQLARGRVLLLTVDDLHWADGATLRALHQISRHLSDSPVLIIATYRSEEAESPASQQATPLRQFLDGLKRERQSRPTAAGRSETAGRPAELHLQPLSLAEVTALTASMAHSPYGGRLFSQRLHRATGGNALFVAETLRALFDQGVLYRDEYGSLATDFDETTQSYEELPVPATVRDVVMDRFRQLSAQQQRALTTAAVIGRAFAFDTWLAATGLREEKLVEALERCLSRQLLAQRADGRYDFSHGVISEVLCRELTPERHRMLHRRVAQALVQQGNASLAGEIAHHYVEAHMWKEALEYLRQAGQSALSLFAHEEAWPYFLKAHEVLEHREAQNGEWRYAIALQMVHLCGILGRHTQAHAYIQEALELARASRDAGRIGETLQAACRHYFVGGQVQKAMELSREAVEWSERSGDARQQANALRQHGYLCYRRGQHDEAFAALEQSLQRSRQVADPQAEAQTLNVLGVAHYYRGDYARAQSLWSETLQLCRRIGFKPVLAQAAGNLGELYRAVGSYPAALVYRNEALQAAREIGFRTIQPDSLLDIGRTLSDLGRHQDAIPFVQEAVDLASEVGHRHFVVQALNGLALVHLRMGGRDQAQQALALTDQARHLAQEIGLRHAEIMALSLRGRALLALGDADAACEASRAAVELMERHTVSEGDEASIYFFHARNLSARGESGQAAAYLGKAKSEMEAKAERIAQDELRESYMKNVPVNRAICEAWEEASRAG